MLPDHIEETIRSIRRLYAEHRQRSTPQQRAMARVTAMVGQPMFLGFLGAAVGLWIDVNLSMAASGYVRSTVPLSLAARRHDVTFACDDHLRPGRSTARGRAHRAARYADFGTGAAERQKAAKMIQLLEEFRRDSPQLSNRRDQEAEVMAQPADPAVRARRDRRDARARRGDASNVARD